jgi:thiamine-monophosphate kinase
MLIRAPLPSTVPADRLGHKALAVNLSDLVVAARRRLHSRSPAPRRRGLLPPRARLFALADREGAAIGGDTTRPARRLHHRLRRRPRRRVAALGCAARRRFYVSGTLGDARLALEAFRGQVMLDGDAFAQVRRAMELPAPRTALGIRLRGVATSAIDVSDGLTGDLGHLLRQSGVGAVVDVDALPRSAVLATQPMELQRECLLAGGDDYELVFTALASRRDAVAAAAAGAGVAVRRIGRIDAGPGLRVVDRSGEDVASQFGSFDHFRT